MKKILVAILALSFLAVPTMNAQSKQLQKLQKKEYKMKLKEYKKGGWIVFGTSHTLEVALLTHYEKLREEGISELVVSTTSTNKNIAKEKLQMNASTKYAQQMGSYLRGRVVEDLGSKLTEDEIAEFETFYAGYENLVASEIKGELVNTFCVCRKVKQGGHDAMEYEAYYIIDMAAASRARIRAFELAAQESAAAQRYAKQVSEFIKEGFEE